MAGAEPTRIDKWLWAARFAKTRALAAEAVKGGRVHVDGHAVKASRTVKPGDTVEVTLAQSRIAVVVRATSERRGPPSEAALLYEETEASRAAREQAAAERRLRAAPVPERGPRPTKRDRRRLQDARKRTG
jgi:ribosome-associated heat shock protein Hsp15